MLNFLLENKPFVDVVNNLLNFLGTPIVIIALVLAMVGVALAFLAKRIAKSVRRTDTLAKNDSVLIGIRVLALVLCLVALVLVSIGSWQIIS